MGFKKYRGPITTVEQASMAGRVLTIKCQCGRERSKWAWHLVQHGEKFASLPLRKPVKGFYCYGCKSGAPVTLFAGGPWS